MPIPQLDDDGFLPIGVHEATIDEIREQFGSFQRTDRRQNLFRQFDEFIGEVRLSNLIDSVIVDGSFVTAKDEPSDIDLILVLKPDHDFAAELRPFEYNVISRRQVRRKHKFDVFVARYESSEYAEYLGFFQQVKELPDRRKGVLVVKS